MTRIERIIIITGLIGLATLLVILLSIGRVADRSETVAQAGLGIISAIVGGLLVSLNGRE